MRRAATAGMVVLLVACGSDPDRTGGTGGTTTTGSGSGTTSTGSAGAGGAGGTSGYVPGPAPTWQWVSTAGSASYDSAHRLALCGETIFVSARTSHGVVFGPGEPNETTLAAANWAIAAYDLQGNLRWAVPIVGTHAGVGAWALLDDCSLIATLGTSDSEIVIGSEPPVASDERYLARLTSDGAVVWIIPSPAEALARVGDTLLATSSDIPTDVVTLYGIDAGDGGVLWSRVLATLSVSGTLYVKRLAVTPAGKLVGLGEFDDSYSGRNDATVTVDPTGNATVLEPVGNDGDIFVFATEPDGTLLWAVPWGDSGMTISRDMALDAAGNVSVCGKTRWSTGRPGEGFLVHFDAAAEEVAWLRTWDGFGANDAMALSWNEGVVTVSGWAEAGAPIVIETGFDHETFELLEPEVDVAGLLLAYDAEGFLQWHRYLPGIIPFAAGPIEGDALLGGQYYEATTTFDTLTVPPATQHDLFIGRMLASE